MPSETGSWAFAALWAMGAEPCPASLENNPRFTPLLKVKANPTFIIYKGGKMKWRQSGDLDAKTLIGLVQKYA